MRLRNITGSEEIIAASALVVKEPAEWKGRWREKLNCDGELHVEAGMGKGRFITTKAEQNPHTAFIGIERYSSVLLRAIQRMEGKELPNLCFLCIDAGEIEEIFAPGEVDCIYLNFSDPWPKDRHAKRRLTSRRFLESFKKVLKPEGSIEFKTDNRALFDFSLGELEPAGFRLIQSTYDLHHDPSMQKGNILTEYEEKFSSSGNPICKYIITRQK